MMKRRWLIFKHAYLRLVTHSLSVIRTGSNILGIINFIASAACLICIAIFFGFEPPRDEWLALFRIMRACQITFLVNVIYNYILNFRDTFCQTRLLKWIVDAGVLITLLPLLYPRPAEPWLPWLSNILYSKQFIVSILAAYSFASLCFGIMKMLGRRTNPSLIMAGSFMVLIIIGSFVLMMPRCTLRPLSYIDSLFIATSAVSITGLCPVELSETFTPTGLAVLALLIQTGALGVMTFTCFFALFFSGSTSIHSQLIVKDMLFSKSFNSLLPTLLYILSFTLIIELAGTAAVFASVHGTLQMSLQDELIFSAFHAMSAFCNAGFSNLEGGLSNPLLLHSNQSVYIITSLLILAGGIGFPILMNTWQALCRRVRRLYRWFAGKPVQIRTVHLLSTNTKIVLSTTLLIFVISSALFFIFEYDNALAGMSLYDKVVQSIFNSFVPRSSGFSSVSPTGFMNITLLMFVILMWIGGGSQSTAGGIKVNTFATMLLDLKSFITGRHRVTVYHRTIANRSVRMSYAIVSLSILSYIIIAGTLLVLEPGLSPTALLYEAASGLFTVGSSLGITAGLSDISKGVLCLAMYFGRVGLISLLIGMAGNQSDPPVKLPEDNIIIN